MSFLALKNRLFCMIIYLSPIFLTIVYPEYWTTTYFLTTSGVTNHGHKPCLFKFTFSKLHF